MNKYSTDYDVIIKDFNKLNNLKKNVPKIMLVNNPNCWSKNNTRFIGEKTAKFTYKNYHIRYRECDDEMNWQVKLLDDSLISFFYSFDKDGNLLEYSLSFIPSFDEGAIEAVKNFSQILPTLTPCFNDYIRIDFSDIGYRSGVHEKQHLHKGLVERNKSRNKEAREEDSLEDINLRNEFRIPINNIIYPLDFIYFIMKYIYDDDEKSLKSIIIDEENKRQNLINLETQDFSINNNFKVKKV